MARRASPPRKALLCRTLEECRSSLERLRNETAKSLAARPGARSWQQLVVEFRALRESLTSIHSHDAALNLVAYELAAQVCLHARDFSEYLKTAQALIQEKFPFAVEEMLLSKQLDATKTSIELENVSEWSNIKARWTLAASLFLLYFVCVPPKPQAMDLLTVLRRLPRWLVETSPVLFAVAAHSAVTTGDHLKFLRLYAQAQWEHRVIMLPRLQEAQKQGMAVIAAAYQNLACDTAEEWLALKFNADPEGDVDDGRKSLLKVLSGASSGGNSRVQRALDRLNESTACKDLIFKS